MARAPVYALALSLLFGAAAVGAQPAKVELVESFPIETSLDTPHREARQVWLELIDSAQKTLDLEVFYIRNEEGKPLAPVIDGIERAARRGVKVRVIADAKFEKTYPETLQRLSKSVPVKRIDFGKGVQHSKYFLVDGRHFFVGSQNFDWTSLEHIRELGVHVESPELARSVQQVFDMDWNGSPPPQAPPKSEMQATFAGQPITFHPAFSPYGRVPQGAHHELDEILQLLHTAQKEAWVEVMTYSPAQGKEYFAALDTGLRAAATRGVQVRLLVADWGLKHQVYLKSLAQLPNVEVRYSKIPAWSGGDVPFARVDHCKFLVVDGSAAWVGTSNWEKGYFYESRDLGLVFRGEPIGKALRDFFLRAWDSSYVQRV